MEDRCFVAEELDELLDLSPDDSRLVHLETCSACRTLLSSYRQFLVGSNSTADAQFDEAECKLTEFLETWVDEADSTTKNRRQRPSLLDRLSTMLRGPAIAPALAATFLLVATTMFLTNRDGDDPQPLSGILRGDSNLEAHTAIATEASLAIEGGLRLSWRHHPEADAYSILILSEDLRTLKDMELGRVNQVEVEIASLSDDPTAARFWRIIAFKGGDEIAKSELATLPQHP